jgi:hypothetical protein
LVSLSHAFPNVHTAINWQLSLTVLALGLWAPSCSLGVTVDAVAGFLTAALLFAHVASPPPAI